MFRSHPSSIPDRLSALPPLDQSKKEIRLIKINAGKHDDPISCTSATFHLGKWRGLPKFLALSYYWGDQEPTESITINGKPIAVTANLNEALRRFRGFHNSSADLPYRSADTWLWIDALSINQADPLEKNWQVPLMTDVYSSATRVLIWLGEGTTGTDSFIDWVQTVWLPGDLLESLWQRPRTSGSSRLYLNFAKRQTLANRTLANTPDDTLWLSLTILFRPWFTRVLTVQEAAAAKKDPLVICGSKMVSLVNLAAVLKLTHDARDWLGFRPSKDVNAILGGVFKFDNPSQLLHQFHANHQRLDCMMNIRLTLTQTRGSDISLHQALDWTSHHHATDPRNTLYGLLGILPESVRARIAVDYRQDLSQVTAQAIQSACESYAFLDTTLSYQHKNESARRQPSWLPDFRQIADGYYMWCRNDEAWQSCPRVQLSPDGKIITLPATPLDTIEGHRLLDFIPYENQTQLQDLDQMASIAQKRTLAADYPLSPFRKLPEHIWRALLLNAEIQLFGSALIEETKYQDLWDLLLRSQPSQRPAAPEKADCFTEWWWTDSHSTLAIFSQEIWQRSFDLAFLTTAHGFLGIGPKASKPGDELMILHGTQAVVALRPAPAAKQGALDGNHAYELIGPVFVLNITGRFKELGTLHKHGVLRDIVVKLL